MPDTTGPWTGKVVSGGRLRIRSGAGMAYGIVGYLNDGAELTILEKATAGGQIWGRTGAGWICLDDVQLDGEEQNTSSATMTVDSCSLRLRDAAGIGSSIVGYLSHGTKVEVLEQTTVDNITWVRTAQGWVNIKYLK